MRTLVLFSGGLDSAVLLASMAPDVVALTFDEGHNRRAIDYAEKFCDVREIEHKVVPLSLGESGPRDGRIFAMLSVASSYAVSLGAKQIAFGATADDRDVFRGSTWSFTQHVNASGILLPVIAPFVYREKWTVLKEGLMQHRVDPRDTWSCVAPGDEPSPCTQCDPCKRRRAADILLLRERDGKAMRYNPDTGTMVELFPRR